MRIDPCSTRRRCSDPSDDVMDMLVVQHQDLIGVPYLLDTSVLEQHHALAVTSDSMKIVADEHDRLAFSVQALQGCEALLLELLVADGQYLVEEQDVEVDSDRDRIRESHLHT